VYDESEGRYRPIVIGYAGGTFDLFHWGHVAFLRRARQQCDYLVVGLNLDDFARQYKGQVPAVGYAGREAVLDACRYVERVIPNLRGADSKPAILESRARRIFHGDDWTGTEYLYQLGLDQAFLDGRGIEVIYIPYTKGVSTSQLRKGTP
jgi:glycerol-3-phosphate cytidylyltransferase